MSAAPTAATARTAAARVVGTSAAPTVASARPAATRGSAGRVAGAGQAGQASVELVALLPAVGVLALVAWQVLLAGGAIWFGGAAARAAARAEAVGADPLRAARGVLPDRYEAGLRVRRERDGGVAVVVAVPTLVGDRSLGAVTTRAHFEAQR